MAGHYLWYRFVVDIWHLLGIIELVYKIVFDFWLNKFILFSYDLELIVKSI